MNLRQRASKIKLVCTDVDGVLTDCTLHYGPESGHWKQFNVRDGAGVKALQNSGIPVALISGMNSIATAQRAKDLGIEDCFMGDADKVSIIHNLSTKYNVPIQDIAYIGDDLIDLGALGIAGFAICPQNAVSEVKKVSHWIVPLDSGQGILRAVAEFILKSKGKWEEVISRYTG
jgi:3-deoxy-D-manno-octulosonate 8-phosphate phosphatase (KDO 8-P phosphatase)